MTPVFCCGFECGILDSGSVHFSNQLAGSISTSTVRSGARSARLNPSTQAGRITGFVSIGSQAVIRAYINFATLPNTTVPIFCIAGPTQAGAYFKQSDSKIYTGSAIGTLGTTGVSVTTGQWYRFDIKVDFTNNIVDVQIDGVACSQLTSSLGGAGGGSCIIGTAATSYSADYFIDDVIISATIADYPIGAGYINHFVPTSDGTHNVAGAADFERTLTGTDITNATTDAFSLVDNIPLDSGTAASSGTFVNMVAPPNATDYVECIFGPAPGVSTPTVAPRAVEVIEAIAQAGTGTGNMESRLNDNGTTSVIYTATTVAGVTTYNYKRKHFATPPTGGSWTIISGNGNFNNIRVRMGSPATVDANPDQYFSSIMIEAEFVPLVVGTGLLPFCISPQPTR